MKAHFKIVRPFVNSKFKGDIYFGNLNDLLLDGGETNLILNEFDDTYLK